MLPLFILVPLFGILLLNLPFRRASRCLAYPFAMAASAAQVGAVLKPSWLLGNTTGRLDRFMALGLRADSLTLVLLLASGIVVLATLLAGRSVFSDERRACARVSVLLLALAGMNGIALLSDLFSLYVFIEVTSVASFVLIAMHRDSRALEGVFKYVVLSSVASVLMLGAVALLMFETGGTSFDIVSEGLQAGGGLWAKIAIGGFLCGLFIKGGLVPFHGWVPGAYSAAPAPVSVFLAGIATKASGIYGLVRLVVTVFPPSQPVNEVLLMVGAVSIAVGSLAALGQRDMKWLLAYSSISQVGYIVMGLGCGTALGVAGAVLHLFNHAVFKALLFVNSAAVEQRLGTTDMRGMGGLAGRMPVTGVTSVIGILSTAGVPPLAGFWSKLVIIIALWKSAHHAYAAVAVLFGVVTLAYLLSMQRSVFFGRTPDRLGQISEASTGLTAAAILLALVTIAVGVLFPWVFGTFLFPPNGLM